MPDASPHLAHTASSVLHGRAGTGISTCGSALVCIGWNFLFDGATGDFASGFSVDYGACLDGPIVVQTLFFVGDGTSAVDSAIKVMPLRDAASGLVEAVGCDGEADFPEPGGICIKSSGACWCNYLGPPYHNILCTEPVAVEPTTWGHIKALYR